MGARPERSEGLNPTYLGLVSGNTVPHASGCQCLVTLPPGSTTRRPVPHFQNVPLSKMGQRLIRPNQTKLVCTRAQECGAVAMAGKMLSRTEEARQAAY